MIIIYKRPSCAYCPMVMKYLDHIGVLYRAEEAEGDNYTTLSKKYGYSVPLVYNDIKKEGHTGYNIPLLKNLVS